MFLNTAHLVGRSGAGRLKYTTVALILLFALVFTVGAQEAEGGTLIVGTNAPQVLDPALGTNDSETLFNGMIYDYLLDILPDNTLAPSLATEYEISEDGLTYTFTLADGVTFHNGSELSAEDVVYTFNRLVEVGSPAVPLLGGEDGFTVEAPDDSTVVFNLAAPNADFLYGVASRWSTILNSASENTFTVSDDLTTGFNGTGAFVLSEFSQGERAVFTRNENYWIEGQPTLAAVEHLYIDDPLAQVDALRGGQVNFIFKVPIDQIVTLESAGNINILETPTNQHAVIRLRTDEGFAGSDPLIREALTIGIDRAELNEVVTEGRGVVGNNNPIGPAYANAYDDSIAQPEYNPERACELIAEATGEERLVLEFYVPDALGYPDLATIMQQQLEAACIDLSIEVQPETVYYSGDPAPYLEVEMGLTGWGHRPVPQQYLVEAYTSTTPFNESRFSTPELDALIEEAGTTTDEAARAEIYSQIAQYFADNHIVIVPYFAPIIGATTDNVEGLVVAPFPGSTDFRTVSIVQ